MKGYPKIYGIDQRALGFFRLFLGSNLIGDLLLYKIPNIDAFYSTTGIFNKQLYSTFINDAPEYFLYKFNLLATLPSDILVYGFFILTALLNIAFTLGYKPRLTGALSFICLLFIHQRNPFLLTGPDLLLITLLAWAILLPVNNAISLFSSNEKSTDTEIRNLAAFGLLLHIAIIYFMNAILKNGNAWKDGTAVAYALMDNPWVRQPFASELLKHGYLTRVITYSTLILEYAVPALIFFPWKNSICRTIAAFLILIFNLTVFIFIETAFLAFQGFIIFLVLLPPPFWNKLFSKKVDTKNQHSEYSSTNMMAGIWLSLIIMCCISMSLALLKANYKHPKLIRYLVTLTPFDQRWGMYAPEPPRYTGWARIGGSLENDHLIDLSTGRSFSEHSKGYIPYKNYTWQMFIYSTCVVPVKIAPELRKEWAKYELLKWNRKHPDKKVKTTYVFFYYQQFNSPGYAPPPRSFIVNEYRAVE